MSRQIERELRSGLERENASEYEREYAEHAREYAADDGEEDAEYGHEYGEYGRCNACNASVASPGLGPEEDDEELEEEESLSQTPFASRRVAFSQGRSFLLLRAGSFRGGGGGCRRGGLDHVPLARPRGERAERAF